MQNKSSNMAALWKQEPASPALSLASEAEEVWLIAGDNVATEVEIGGDDEVKTTRAQYASKLLLDLDQWDKEEEPFPDWLEEKIDLPIFDDLPPPPTQLINTLDLVGLKGLDMVTVKTPEIACKAPPSHPQTLLSLNPVQYPTPIVIPPPATTIPIDQTSIMMHEFDYGLEQQSRIPMQPHDTLTPPDSPREADLVFTMLQEMQPHELDELVRMRVESLVETPADSTRSSTFEESESASSPCSDGGYSDPDWSLSFSTELKTPTKRRRVTKPYARAPPEEKKLRKKEQNKNAATRYRMKKKQEVEEVLGEEKHLRQTNENLKQELTELTREIKYLKSLMRDMFKAKGLIK